jgi:hypothetical protein
MTATLTAIRPLPNVSVDLSPALRAEFARAAAVAADLRSSQHHLGHAARCAVSEGLTEDEFAARAALAYVSEGGKPSRCHLDEPPALLDQPRRRQTIWRLYRELWTRHHLTPSIRDVQHKLEISSHSVVVYHLDKLVAAGLLDHLPGGVAHAYRLPKDWR